jgi:hypothetical protein
LISHRWHDRLLRLLLCVCAEGQLSGNVELVVEAAYQATVATHWLEAHPSVLLAEVRQEGRGARGGAPLAPAWLQLAV